MQDNDQESDSDEIRVIDLELIPEDQEERVADEQRAPERASWSSVILPRVFCFFLLIFMAWFIFFCALIYLVTMVVSLFNPRVAAGRASITRRFFNSLIVGAIFIVGGFIGVFSPRWAVLLVGNYLAAVHGAAKSNPFENVWRSGMGGSR